MTLQRENGQSQIDRYLLYSSQLKVSNQLKNQPTVMKTKVMRSTQPSKDNRVNHTHELFVLQLSISAKTNRVVVLARTEGVPGG